MGSSYALRLKTIICTGKKEGAALQLLYFYLPMSFSRGRRVWRSSSAWAASRKS